MIDFTQEANIYVSLVLNEVHIKEDDKHEDSLIGFVNLGDINNHLLNFEKSLTDEPELMPNHLYLHKKTEHMENLFC